MFNNEINHNPDVLDCLANLSNDEVFTPPKIANQMLDMLPQELFSDPETTFLDPACKSGVFLREIAKRLIEGLKDKIPNLEKRIEHIYKKQLFGIAITELTSLLSRRSLYCSKYPNSIYSICKFDDIQGNIRFKNYKHTFNKENCKYCGASESEYGEKARGEGMENHAYEFIHRNDLEEIFNMKFDVIISNPPYQLNTAGEDNGKQAKPIYHFFILQGLKMKPRYLSMIVPSKWFSAGWGLDEFRRKMITGNQIIEMHDFPNAQECFPGVQIKGGVNYFLMGNEYSGKCKFVSHLDGEQEESRYLKEENSDILIRYNLGVDILHKIKKYGEKSLSEIVSSQKPFGLGSSFHGDEKDDNVKVYENKRIGFIKKEDIPKIAENFNKYKVFISAAYGAGEDFPHQILNKPILAGKNTCCTETYISIGSFQSEEEAKNLCKYIQCKFFRFLVLLSKNTQHALKKVYQFVPVQDFSNKSEINWNNPIDKIDEQLFKKYKLSSSEIKFINKMIKPMVIEGK